MLTKEQQVEKVVEWVARELYSYHGNPHQSWDTCSVRGQYRYTARQILFHPKIRVEDDDQSDPDNQYVHDDGAMEIGYKQAMEDKKATNFRKVI